MAATSGIAKRGRLFSARAAQRALDAASESGTVGALVGEPLSRAEAAVSAHAQVLAETGSWLAAGVRAAEGRARAQLAALSRTARGASALVAPSAGGAAFAYAFTTSWERAIEVCAWVLALSLLVSLRATLRGQQQALAQQLAELKESLHVTQALLHVEELEGAEVLDEDAEAAARAGDEPPMREDRLGRLRRHLRRTARR